MSAVFNADEVFEIAEQIERNGAKFYRKAAEGIAEADRKQILLDLAAMEDRHEKVFADMRASLSGQQKQPTVFDPEGESALYLRAMAEGVVFDFDKDPSEQLSGAETLEQILRRAIELERDSIAFYVGIRQIVPDALGKDQVDRIIKEEMSHITTLSGQLTALKGL